MASSQNTQQAFNSRTSDAFKENFVQLTALADTPENIQTIIVEDEVFSDANDTSYADEIKGGWIGVYSTLKVQKAGITQADKYFLADNASLSELVKQIAVANDFLGDLFARLVEEGTLNDSTFVGRVDADIDDEITELNTLLTKKNAEKTDLGLNGINWTRQPHVVAILKYLNTIIS